MITVVQDLSGMFRGGPISALVPTSQSAGNTTSENLAMTAPGSASEAVPADLVNPAPVVDAIAHEPTVLTDGHDAPAAAPFTVGDGTPWQRAADSAVVLPETSGRPRVQLGEWNQL